MKAIARNDRPRYSRRPIGSVDTLARYLGLEPAELVRLSGQADRLYRGPKRHPKDDGTFRETFDAYPPLKWVQDRIQKRLLRAVTFPDYLMGGIHDPEGTRGYIRNARRHAGARLLLGEDAENFFPSVTIGRVNSIFRDVFHFPPPVALTLAKLCTRRGALVQGAITSTYLANLALYREEPELVRQLRADGFDYSRLIDDMNASARQFIGAARRTRAVQLMRATLEKAGIRPKRVKQEIKSAGEAMRVNKLNVSGTASRNERYRKKLRAAVFQLELSARDGTFDADWYKTLQSAATRIGALRQLNPGEAQKLGLRLQALKRMRRHAQATCA